MTEAERAALAGEVLEALALERRPPDFRFLEDLFLRFQRRVPAETLTRPSGDPGEFDPEGFFAGWIEEERGLVGEERARAFEWLAAECGFEATLKEGTCRRPWEEDAPGRGESRLGSGEGVFPSKVNLPVAHRAVVASIEGRRVLADAGFPMPVLLPLDPPGRELPTAFGSLTVEEDREKGSARVTCDARGEVADLLQLVPPLPEPSLPLEEICRPSPYAGTQQDPRGSFALRVLDDRVLYWRAGRMTILDAWSRLEYPLPASERAALGKLFALDVDGVTIPEEPRNPDPSAPATLRVFHLSPLAAAEARVRAAAGGEAPSLVARREVSVEESGDGSRITVTATLGKPVPPEGPGETLRKTLVFHLVSDLFDLSRG